MENRGVPCSKTGKFGSFERIVTTYCRVSGRNCDLAEWSPSWVSQGGIEISWVDYAENQFLSICVISKNRDTCQAAEESVLSRSWGLLWSSTLAINAWMWGGLPIEETGSDPDRSDVVLTPDFQRSRINRPILSEAGLSIW